MFFPKRIEEEIDYLFIENKGLHPIHLHTLLNLNPNLLLPIFLRLSYLQALQPLELDFLMRLQVERHLLLTPFSKELELSLFRCYIISDIQLNLSGEGFATNCLR